MNVRKHLTKQQREAIWNKYNHHCAYCGCELPYKDMQIDHINSVFKAEYKAGRDITKVKVEELNANDNLLPACRQCNFYKGVSSVEQFREKLTNMLMNNLRHTFQFRLAVKHGLVTDNRIGKVKFYFEKIRDGKVEE